MTPSTRKFLPSPSQDRRRRHEPLQARTARPPRLQYGMITKMNSAHSNSDSLRLLRLQVEKYRLLEKAAPHGSGARKAAKATADLTQEGIDFLIAESTETRRNE